MQRGEGQPLCHMVIYMGWEVGTGRLCPLFSDSRETNCDQEEMWRSVGD
jgi:hypothetical protein